MIPLKFRHRRPACLSEASQAKLFANELLQEAMQIHSFYGYLEDYAVERL